jgi:hypothetical protein
MGPASHLNLSSSHPLTPFRHLIKFNLFDLDILSPDRVVADSQVATYLFGFCGFPDSLFESPCDTIILSDTAKKNSERQNDQCVPNDPVI